VRYRLGTDRQAPNARKQLDNRTQRNKAIIRLHDAEAQ